jgi:hypothetical protein
LSEQEIHTRVINHAPVRVIPFQDLTFHLWNVGIVKDKMKKDCPNRIDWDSPPAKTHICRKTGKVI